MLTDFVPYWPNMYHKGSFHLIYVNITVVN